MGSGRGGGQRGRGPRCRIFKFLNFIFLFMRCKSNEVKGAPNVSIIIKHSNETRRNASNLKSRSFNFKYHITPENTKC